MKTFSQWLEKNNLKLPVVSDTPDAEDATAENTKRSGISANYPDAYVRQQYPHKYFNSIAADADYKLEAKPKKPSDTAA